LKSFVLALIVSISIFPQQVIKSKSDDQPGGKLLPSEGRIHALFIFAQFPDDNYDPNNAEWKKNDAPRRVKDNTWVDAEWTGKPTPWSTTDFYNEMSFGKLQFTGKTISVTAPQTRQWYMENNKRLSDIHRDIVAEVNKTIDFAEFDNWTRVKSFEHRAAPDGVVDMIFFVWRNIHLDIQGEESPKTLNKLGFGWFGTTGAGTIHVDNKKRQIHTTSGVTIQDFFSKDPFTFCVHEFGHYLIGGNDYHHGYGFWALLNGYGSVHYMINSFERHRLGWSTFKTIPPGSSPADVRLRDFITTGDALRIEIDAKRNRYFYVENHQRISKWDKPSVVQSEKGLYVLRQNMASGDNKFMQIIPADGKYTWEVTGYEYPAYYPQGVPVFRRLKPDRKNGYLDTEPVPFTYEGKEVGAWEIIFYNDTLTGKPVDYPLRNGDGRHAFRPDYKNVFSPWSNPPSVTPENESTGIGFFIKNENNGVINLAVYSNSSTDGPPAKPDRPELSQEGNNVIIRWIRNEEPDAAGYYIYKIEGGREEQIGRTDQNASEYRHRTRSRDKNIIYKVSCFDRSGLESLKSENGEWIN
jgi:M6 family metalloprotease-like protein